MAIAREDMELLTIDEVARRLRVHRTTVWKLVKSNRLPAVQLTPRITRIPRSAVESILSERTAGEQVPLPTKEARTEKGRGSTAGPFFPNFERVSSQNVGRHPLSESTEILRELRSQRAAR